MRAGVSQWRLLKAVAHYNLILCSNLDRQQAVSLDRLAAKLPKGKLATAEWDQLQDFMTKHATALS